MTAVTKKIKWDFHLPPKADTCAKFQLSRLLGGLARECDVRQMYARSQVKIELTQPCSAGLGPELGNKQTQLKVFQGSAQLTSD